MSRFIRRYVALKLKADATGDISASYDDSATTIDSGAHPVLGKSERGDWSIYQTAGTYPGLYMPAGSGLASYRIDNSPGADLTFQTTFTLYRQGWKVPIRLLYDIVTLDEFFVEVSRSSQEITLAGGDSASALITIAPPVAYGSKQIETKELYIPWL